MKHPIVIIGGGMVGACLALGLCQMGLEVVIVESKPIDLCDDPLHPYRNRVSAIQRSSEALLKKLGVWPEIEARRFLPFKQMHIQDDQGFHTKLNAMDLNEYNLGYLIENDVITASIWSLLNTHPLCRIEQTTPIAATQSANGNWHIRLANEQLIETTLLIGADGAKSQVRQWLGLNQQTLDYQQHCIVGNVRCEQNHQFTCWQHYRHEGPFALLPLADKLCSIAWYLPSEKVETYLSMSLDEQSHEITQASANMLGQLTPIGSLSAFPLIKRQTSHYIGDHALIIGDAAHTLHPQAGQGVNLGFLDVIALLNSLSIALKHHQPLGDKRVLQRYERARKHDASLIQNSMDGLNWFFSDQPLAQGIRNFTKPMAQVGALRALISAQGLYGRFTGLTFYE